MTRPARPGRRGRDARRATATATRPGAGGDRLAGAGLAGHQVEQRYGVRSTSTTTCFARMSTVTGARYGVLAEAVSRARAMKHPGRPGRWSVTGVAGADRVRAGPRYCWPRRTRRPPAFGPVERFDVERPPGRGGRDPARRSPMLADELDRGLRGGLRRRRADRRPLGVSLPAIRRRPARCCGPARQQSRRRGGRRHRAAGPGFRAGPHVHRRLRGGQHRGRRRRRR